MIFLSYSTFLPILLSLSSAFAAPPALNPDTKVAAAWYAGWHSEDFPLSKVPWSKYTQVTYSFAVTTPDVKKLSFDGSNEGLIPDFVKAAHKNGVKASVSIGGWTGSRYFSTSVGSAENRTAFVKTVIDMATKYKLDAIDFDWEYPGTQGLGCNIVSPQDTSNYLAFLQELRKDSLGAKLILTAATSIKPWMDASGNPSSSVAEFSKVLDYIAIMNYDIWGSWAPTVGPNAPLADSCADPSNQVGSGVSAVKAWTDAGFPADQVVLGVPSYGHSFTVTPESAFVPGSQTELAAYPKFNASNPPIGDSWDGGAGVDECGNETGPGGSWNFWGLMDEGFLNKKGDPAQGIAYRFDSCSMTPYLYNSTRNLMVSYDNAESFGAKGGFIKQMNLRGFAVWEAGGDPDNILLDSILNGTANGTFIEPQARTNPSPESSAESLRWLPPHFFSQQQSPPSLILCLMCVSIAYLGGVL